MTDLNKGRSVSGLCKVEPLCHLVSSNVLLLSDDGKPFEVVCNASLIGTIAIMVEGAGL